MTTLPSFLERLKGNLAMQEPQVPFTPRPRPVDPATERAIADIVENRRRLEAALEHNEALLARVSDLERELSFLRERFSIVEDKANFYQRHSTELLTQLSTIGLVIDTAREAAKAAAWTEPQHTPPDVVSDAATAALNSLPSEPSP